MSSKDQNKKNCSPKEDQLEIRYHIEVCIFYEDTLSTSSPFFVSMFSSTLCATASILLWLNSSAVSLHTKILTLFLFELFLRFFCLTHFFFYCYRICLVLCAAQNITRKYIFLCIRSFKARSFFCCCSKMMISL
jgi:hypothetical protein